MGIVSNIVDFVFPIQRTSIRPNLYRPTGRFVNGSTQFRSHQLQRRFSQRRLWPNGQVPYSQVRSTQVVNTSQFIRPLAPRPIPQPVQKRSFLESMFSNNINPPSMRPQPKRNGFGGKVLTLARWNNILRR